MILQSLGDLLWILLFFPLFLLGAILLLPGFLRLLTKCKTPPALDPQSSKRILSPMQAVSATLAATVGTGNIIGTGQAVAMGGPGAVFWMWVAALLGCCIKCAEIWFGQLEGRGTVGTIRSALGNQVSAVYAFLAVLSTLFVGNMAQMNAVISSLGFDQNSHPGSRFVLSSLLLFFLAAAVYRGVSTLGKLCSYVVPLMTAVYLAASALILFENRGSLLPSLRLIVSASLHPGAMLGACGGMTVRNAVLWGFRRGVFSNEAGLGTAGTIHSLVEAAQPDRHALLGIWEVGVDTLLLCTVSALTLLCSGARIPHGSLPGAEFWLQVFSSASSYRNMAPSFGLCLNIFAISTVLGCYVSGSLCAGSIGIGENSFRLLFLLCAVLGCLLPTNLIWLASDLINVLMATPNLLSMILLAPSFAAGCEQSKNNPEKSGIRSCPRAKKGVR